MLELGIVKAVRIEPYEDWKIGLWLQNHFIIKIKLKHDYCNESQDNTNCTQNTIRTYPF
jgi:hypothetical protein